MNGESTLAWIASRMLSGGGAVIVEVEADFDESGSHRGSPVLCVAGYIIDKTQLSAFDGEWNAVLNSPELPYALPYFHMVDCAHGQEPFADLTMEQRIDVETRMIDIIKRRTLIGLAITVNQGEFDRLIPQDRALVGSAYSFCAQIILGGVSHWIGENTQVDKAAYFFEAGHKSAAETDWIMQTLFRNERANRAHRYAGHGFVPKEGNPAVQAADLLAWQWYTDRRHQIEGRPRRKDCASLLRHRHRVAHAGPDMLNLLAVRLSDISRPLTREAFFFGDEPV